MIMIGMLEFVCISCDHPYLFFPPLSVFPQGRDKNGSNPLHIAEQGGRGPERLKRFANITQKGGGRADPGVHMS